MYNPPPEGTTDGDEFEFIELKNIGSFALDLSGLFFSGINFTFTNGTTLARGTDVPARPQRSCVASAIPGRRRKRHLHGRLDNAGETIEISHPHGGTIVSVTYDDRAPWPVTADGFGYSLVLADAATRNVSGGRSTPRYARKQWRRNHDRRRRHQRSVERVNTTHG